MRRLIRDIGVFRPRDTRGRIQGRILGVLGGSCEGLVCQVPVYDHYPVYEVELNFGLSCV